MHNTDDSNLAVSARPTSRWPWLIAAAWLVAVAIGMGLLWRYSSTPGETAQPPQHWPENSQIELNASGDTLIMFAHRHCPCTRASLTELQRILTASPKNVATWIVFNIPSDAEAGWERSDLSEMASSIVGSHIIADLNGTLMHRFHVATSGQTLLYDSSGALRFSGGITSARGHEGDNAGQIAILEWLNNGKSSCHETPVYGCAIEQKSTSQ